MKLENQRATGSIIHTEALFISKTEQNLKVIISTSFTFIQKISKLSKWFHIRLSLNMCTT